MNVGANKQLAVSMSTTWSSSSMLQCRICY